jgi:hypothetical protein
MWHVRCWKGAVVARTHSSRWWVAVDLIARNWEASGYSVQVWSDSSVAVARQRRALAQGV